MFGWSKKKGHQWPKQETYLGGMYYGGMLSPKLQASINRVVSVCKGDDSPYDQRNRAISDVYKAAKAWLRENSTYQTVYPDFELFLCNSAKGWLNSPNRFLFDCQFESAIDNKPIGTAPDLKNVWNTCPTKVEGLVVIDQNGKALNRKELQDLCWRILHNAHSFNKEDNNDH